MKKLLIASATVLSIASVATFGVSRQGVAEDVSPIVVQVQKHETQLQNHEDRITNVEKDVSVLQDNTQTPPSNTKVVVREVLAPQPDVAQPVTSQPEVVVAPAPVTVVSYEKIPLEGTENTDCRVTYSDGTSRQWHWQTTEYNQGTKISQTNGSCRLDPDDRFID